MRSFLLIMSMAALAATGCASPPDDGDQEVRLISAGTGRSAALATALLFDPEPGCYRASDFAFRSEWPSTDSFYSPGQVIYFRERFVDVQGRQFGESDYTYRRFDTYRVGVGYR
jgi:hypothetical protein